MSAYWMGVDGFYELRGKEWVLLARGLVQAPLATAEYRFPCTVGYITLLEKPSQTHGE